MTLQTAIVSAIEALRPGTDPDHAERIARDCTAKIRGELRWLDIYEEEKRCRF